MATYQDISLSKKSRANLEVNFTTSSVVVSLDNSCIVIFKLRGIELSPRLCNGLIALPNDEIQLRVQASGAWVTDVYYENYERHQQNLVSAMTYSYEFCSCAFCHQPVFDKSRKFDRVLPLPSDDWSDLSNMWFCHQTCGHHKNGTSSTISSTLKHRETDCLVGDLHFLVHLSFIDLNNCFIFKCRDLLCKRCHAHLGSTSQAKHKGRHKHSGDKASVDNSIIKIHWHSVTFDPVSSTHCTSSTSFRHPLEHQLACYLIDQSHAFTCFRFILQSRDNGLERVASLVWLLDTDGLMYQSQPCPQPRPMSEPPGSVNTLELECERVVKLLYQVSFKSFINSEKRALFTRWHSDQSVTLLNLPYSLHASLIHILLNNTACLPHSLRFLNDFHVGYLHKDKSHQLH